MYLHAIWLSDLCTENGVEVGVSVWQGELVLDTLFNWLVVSKPTKAKWSQWQRALTWTLSLDRWQQLAHHLGPWFLQESPYGWFFEPNTSVYGTGPLHNGNAMAVFHGTHVLYSFISWQSQGNKTHYKQTQLS